MALNPYTLYHLYEKGILEYVPTDLMYGTPVAPMFSASNPYLEMAQQGGLYQNHGIYNDTFQMGGGVQSPYANQPSNPVPAQVQIGSMSQAGGMNTFQGVGVGAASPVTTAGLFGFDDATGAYTQAGGMNTFNGVGIGGQSQAGGMNTFGGFSNVQNGLANGYNSAMSLIDRTPKVILGLAAAAIGIIGLKHAFNGVKIFGKKSSNTSNTESFLSKLNPKNWSWFSKKS